MHHRMKTSEGEAVHARRMAMVETVLAVINEARCFRRFSMRGHAATGAAYGPWRPDDRKFRRIPEIRGFSCPKPTTV